ncbi:MAG TPA: hypothetical protein VH561_15725 [Micromonosporaceae bacterium]
MLTSTPPMATPAHIADDLGPHLTLLAVLVLAGAAVLAYRRLRRNKDGR